jgi:DNA-binding transcriptional regulator YiaG
MPNIAVVLKQEIRRLARKEVRAANAATSTVVAQLRKGNAALRKQLTDLQRHVTMLRRSLGKGGVASASAPQAEERGLRFSAKGVASLRRRLGLSANDFARLAGVSAQSVYLWERGQRPRAKQLQALAATRKLSAAGARELLAKARTQKKPARKPRSAGRKKAAARR